MKLILEINKKFTPTNSQVGIISSHILMTPAIGDDYWECRVKLYKDQALLGFPKFSTIGIGFAKEKDWRRQLHILSVFLLSAILSRGLITEIIRFFYHRPRPFLSLNLTPLIHDFSNSFPSGHMTFFFVLALSIFLLNKKWGWFFVAGVILMGLGRIFVGVHWPSDILGGILIALLSYFLIKKILPFKNKTA